MKNYLKEFKLNFQKDNFSVKITVFSKVSKNRVHFRFRSKFLYAVLEKKIFKNSQGPFKDIFLQRDHIHAKITQTKKDRRIDSDSVRVAWSLFVSGMIFLIFYGCSESGEIRGIKSREFGLLYIFC